MVSAYEYSCAHEAQISFGDLTPYGVKLPVAGNELAPRILTSAISCGYKNTCKNMNILELSISWEIATGLKFANPTQRLGQYIFVHFLASQAKNFKTATRCWRHL